MALSFTISGPSGGIDLPQEVSLAGGEAMGAFDSVWKVEVFVDTVSKGNSSVSWTNALWPKVSTLTQGASLTINYTYGAGFTYVYNVSMAFYLKIFTLEWNGSGYDSNEYNTNILNFSVNGVPSKATNPSPANNGTSIDFSNLTLSWSAG